MRPHGTILRLPVVDASVIPLLASKKTNRHYVGMGRPGRTVADKALMAAAGQRLRWVREVLGMSQAQIAEAVGITQSAWSLYELGKRWPDQFEAPRLASKLKISLDYMLNGSLDEVERELAIRLAARHPELVFPSDTVDCTDTIPA